jgi:hypothetical protein
VIAGYQGEGEWDFRTADTKEYTHCFHIYPAMMIPQVARGLIQLYGEKDGFLFDPYCGTGTSLVEARVAGMDAAGTDLNPTARFIANAKTRDYDLELLQTDISEFLFGLKEVLTGVEDYTGFNEPECVTFERLEDWFPRRTIGEICTVMNAIGSIQSELNRMFLRIALSECLRLVSYQRNGEFKLYRISPEKREEFHEPLFPLLKKRIQRNLEGCISFGTQVDSTTSATIHGFNTVDDDGLELIGRKPTLVVTSPPYGDSGTTVAYAQFSWLTNIWLGLDSRSGALDRELMGGRRLEFTKFGFKPMDDALESIHEDSPKRAQEVMHFYSEYLASMNNVASIIEKGGHACYVVGNRTVKGIQLPTDQFTVWAFEQQGFTHEVTFIREIPNKRMPSRNSPSNVTGKTAPTMHNEYLVVCKK